MILTEFRLKMSLSKRLCAYNEMSSCVKRDSFERRICDDLCEEILQYLPVEAKAKLEGVSHQFKRAITKLFQKQVGLEILISPSEHLDFETETKFFHEGLKFYKSLINKCPNLQTIDFAILPRKCSYMLYLAESELLIHLIEKCDKLINIYSLHLEGTEYAAKKFQEKFGSQIKSLLAVAHDEETLNGNPNLEYVYIEDLERSSHLKLTKLKRIKIESYFTAEWIEGLKYSPLGEIENLKLVERGRTNQTIFQILDVFPNMEKLKTLQICSSTKVGSEGENSWSVDSKAFVVAMNRLGDTCRSLKCLAMDWSGIDYSFPIILDSLDGLGNIVTALSKFKHLKRLSLEFIELPDTEIGNMCATDLYEILSLKAFRKLSELEYLSLGIHTSLIFGLAFVEDMESYFPNLKVLILKFLFDATHEDIDLITRTIGRMKFLREFAIQCDAEVDIDYFQKKISEDCTKLRHFYLQGERSGSEDPTV